MIVVAPSERRLPSVPTRREGDLSPYCQRVRVQEARVRLDPVARIPATRVSSPSEPTCDICRPNNGPVQTVAAEVHHLPVRGKRLHVVVQDKAVNGSSGEDGDFFVGKGA